MGGPRRMVALTQKDTSKVRDLLRRAMDDPELAEFARALMRKVDAAPVVDVPVLLTISEARAVETAVDNSMHSDEDIEALFQTKARREAAIRGANKLSSALRERQTPRR